MILRWLRAYQASLPAIRPRFLPSSPPRRSSRPLVISGYHPSYAHLTHTHTQSRPGTPVSPSMHVGAFLRFVQPTPRERRRRHRLVRAAICPRCTKCSARLVRGRFVDVSAGLRAAGSQPQCGTTAIILFLPRRFLFHFPSRCCVAIITHAHAARRDVTWWTVTTAVETVAVIATGGRPIARRVATFGGVVAAPRDAAQLRETEMAAGWRPRRGRVVAPRCVLLWR